MINKAVIIGNLTKEIELRKTRDNRSTCSFTVACQRNYKNADDEYESDFINCVAYAHSADYLSNYAHKGDMIAVSGRIQTRNYKNNDGKTVYVTEIVCDDASIVHSREKNTEKRGETTRFEEKSQNFAISEEELPFY